MKPDHNRITRQIEPDLQHILDHTRDLWSALRRESVFITGGTGFLGRWLLEGFIAANQALNLRANAVVLTRWPEKFTARAPHLAAHPSVQLVRGNVRSFDPEDLANGGIDRVAGRIPFVIHAAAETSPQSAMISPFHVLDTSYMGTRRVLEWAVSQRVARVLLISSGAVYGTAGATATRLSEDDTGAPDCGTAFNASAEGKRVMESLGAVFREQYHLDCKVARCFAFVGPGMPLQASSAIGNFIHDALNSAALQIKGEDTALRSYLYTADLAIWLWTLLLRDSASHTFNVGSAETLPVRVVAERIAAQVGKPTLGLESGPAESPVPVEPGVPDIGRARRELGLDVWISLDEAIRRTLAHYETASRLSFPEAVAV